jgi:(p)ppGpp synthase/HD superfamily hydrolase
MGKPSVELSDRFVRALSFAIGVHRDQTRKGTDVTYVSHLLAVASIVLDFGGDEDQAIAGLFHDSMEDSDDGEAVAVKIAEQFGPPNSRRSPSSRCSSAAPTSCTTPEQR